MQMDEADQCEEDSAHAKPVSQGMCSIQCYRMEGNFWGAKSQTKPQNFVAATQSTGTRHCTNDKPMM